MRFRSFLAEARDRITELGERMDKVFLLPPSFFALVGGTFLSIAIDLTRTLLSAPENQANYIRMILLSISAISISTGSFLFLSVKLEGIRGKTPLHDLLENGIRRTEKGKRSNRRQLWFALMIGSFSAGLCLFSLALGYFAFRSQGVVDC